MLLSYRSDFKPRPFTSGSPKPDPTLQPAHLHSSPTRHRASRRAWSLPLPDRRTRLTHAYTHGLADEPEHARCYSPSLPAATNGRKADGRETVNVAVLLGPQSRSLRHFTSLASHAWSLSGHAGSVDQPIEPGALGVRAEKECLRCIRLGRPMCHRTCVAGRRQRGSRPPCRLARGGANRALVRKAHGADVHRVTWPSSAAERNATWWAAGLRWRRPASARYMAAALAPAFPLWSGIDSGI